MGSANFFATLGGSFVIVLLHRLLARILCQWPHLTSLVKGKPLVLVRDGSFNYVAMRKGLVTPQDLEEDMHLEAQVDEASKIKIARLETSGDISFVLQTDTANR